MGVWKEKQKKMAGLFLSSKMTKNSPLHAGSRDTSTIKVEVEVQKTKRLTGFFHPELLAKVSEYHCSYHSDR